jgi:hypothetical protein
MKWEFVTRPIRGVGYVAWRWEWRTTADEGTVKTSERTFSTFRECVADARMHGFTGDPEPGGFGPFFQRPQARFIWS